MKKLQESSCHLSVEEELSVLHDWSKKLPTLFYPFISKTETNLEWKEMYCLPS